MEMRVPSSIRHIPAEEVHAALNQSAKASKFDPFYQSLFDGLQTAAYTNAATFAWVHSFLESGPMPDYEIVTRYLKYWAHNEEPGKWIAHKLAKRLICGSIFTKRA